MYETDWYNSGDVVPDQVTPASDAIPSNSIVNGSAGTSNEYARGDHQHPLQVSTVLPAKDTANGEVGVATTYARSDHTHHVNLTSDIPLKDTRTGTAGTANIYASATHQHPLNVDPTTANVPLVNATAAANVLYQRQHLKLVIILEPLIKQLQVKKHYAAVNSGNMQINPTAIEYDDGLRISITIESTGGSSIFLGCSRSSNIGTIDNQWQIFTLPSSYSINPIGLNISLSADSGDTARGSKSLGTDGVFYTDGITVFWRDHALQFDPFYQG
ncbi:MAG: hypothetical protein EZS28_022115 [Streblomastix strix]|uniref:Uncharacterized protein n=1 Tax=Streblomastix strix TaxID=222440 RepID=A0A5J4VIV3_9EUKA|nr:MAG: hypothetical protein EZS28_022115 [Streblomastix strix]